MKCCFELARWLSVKLLPRLVTYRHYLEPRWSNSFSFDVYTCAVLGAQVGLHM